MCGENSFLSLEKLALVGSSPRVRGKLDFLRKNSGSTRLIPACAGKTRRYRPRHYHRRAHPRVCGENPHASSQRASPPGSSPRVRGKPFKFSGRRSRVRLIPACAGKTKPQKTLNKRKPAHPRVCGENMISCVLWLVAPGSSPRVRGKLGLTTGSVKSYGLIPACAGKTISH